MQRSKGKRQNENAPGAKHVIVLVESSATYGRSCAQGIARYARNHGQWLIRHMPHNQMPHLNPNIPWKWEWDGLIARISSKRLINLVRKLNLPTVDIMAAVEMEGVAVVEADHETIVALAIDHLLSIGLTHLAFCGVVDLPFSDKRQAAFEKHTIPPQITRHIYSMPASMRKSYSAETQRWLQDLKALRAWVEDLPKPVGIVACNDTRARHVLEVCLAAGLSVPEEVCVVGVDNDDVTCELSTPSLTSVDPNAEAIGFKAAQVLDDMMRGDKRPEAPILIPPLGIEHRESTNTQAFEHADLNKAVRFIVEHCHEGIDVGTVVNHVGTSRSTLERRFRDLLGCTPRDYIHRHRMERVQRLLLETSYPAAQIARMMGFGTNPYFAAAFRKHFGMTPGEFRRRYTGQ